MRVARRVKLTGKIWREPDRIVQGRSKIIEPFMATGVGAARYGDLNSDLPVCISQDFLHIQTVTGLAAALVSRGGHQTLSLPANTTGRCIGTWPAYLSEI